MTAAFSSLLRKTIRSSFLSSISSKPRHYSCVSSSPNIGTKISQTLSKPSDFLPFRFVSTAHSAEKKADSKLKRILEAEIIHQEESGAVDERADVPEDFPFEIIDNPGEQIITLKRELAGESIQVEVHKPDIADEEEDESDDDDRESSSNLSISLIVTVSKGDGTSLEFLCTADPQEISVDSMLMKCPDVSLDRLAYEGPKFSDLDERLQTSFYKYLAERGINSSLTEFLQDYMINKEEKEYLGWLKNMKEFIGN